MEDLSITNTERRVFSSLEHQYRHTTYFQFLMLNKRSLFSFPQQSHFLVISQFMLLPSRPIPVCSQLSWSTVHTAGAYLLSSRLLFHLSTQHSVCLFQSSEAPRLPCSCHPLCSSHPVSATAAPPAAHQPVFAQPMVAARCSVWHPAKVHPLVSGHICNLSWWFWFLVLFSSIRTNPSKWLMSVFGRMQDQVRY